MVVLVPLQHVVVLVFEMVLVPSVEIDDTSVVRELVYEVAVVVLTVSLFQPALIVVAKAHMEAVEVALEAAFRARIVRRCYTTGFVQV